MIVGGPYSVVGSKIGGGTSTGFDDGKRRATTAGWVGWAVKMVDEWLQAKGLHITTVSNYTC
jgi:hypothetical protein